MLKFFRLNSIRDRILGGFLFLTVLIIISAIFSTLAIDRTRKIASIHSDINELQVFSLNLIKADNDFFNREIYDQTYLHTRKSRTLNIRDSLNNLIQVRIKKIILKSSQLNYPVGEFLIQIDSLLSHYNNIFYKLEELFYIRGFKDEGIEGQMRYHAHQLEEPKLKFDQLDLLSLRRSEKDFLIRHDTVYVDHFSSHIDKIKKSSVMRDTTLPVFGHLSRYHDLFLRLAVIQGEIGLNANDGLRGKLNNLTEALSERYFVLAKNSHHISALAQRDAWIFHAVTMVLAIFFSILTGYWISKRISGPVARLSSVMEKALEKYPIPVPNLNKAASEINILTASFAKLMNETSRQMKEIKGKSLLVKKQNKELKKLNSELDSFLYSAAHDLRSPLASLLGVLHLLRIDNRQKEVVPYIEMMEKSIRLQEAFISQIVEFTKNKRLTLMPEKIHLKQLLEDIFESHRFVDGAPRITHDVTIQGEAIFYSDKNRINIIFNNLISNAIRYADLGKDIPFIRISVNISREEVSVRFSDNGIGIEPEHIGRIFEMFYRANSRSKGSGLGLFIFAETIQKLRGFVTVESETGKGTNFFIRLPNLSPEYQLHFEAEHEILSEE